MLSKKDRLLARNVRHVEEPVKIKERIAKVSETYVSSPANPVYEENIPSQA